MKSGSPEAEFYEIQASGGLVFMKSRPLGVWVLRTDSKTKVSWCPSIRCNPEHVIHSEAFGVISIFRHSEAVLALGKPSWCLQGLPSKPMFYWPDKTGYVDIVYPDRLSRLGLDKKEKSRISWHFE